MPTAHGNRQHTHPLIASLFILSPRHDEKEVCTPSAASFPPDHTDHTTDTKNLHMKGYRRKKGARPHGRSRENGAAPRHEHTHSLSQTTRTDANQGKTALGDKQSVVRASIEIDGQERADVHTEIGIHTIPRTAHKRGRPHQSATSEKAEFFSVCLASCMSVCLAGTPAHQENVPRC